MRLADDQIKYIKSTIKTFDRNAKIYLFGSRIDDNKKGGDIDLLIMSDKLSYEYKRKIRLNLYELLGEQKIDIVIASDTKDPFVRIALKEGILL